MMSRLFALAHLLINPAVKIVRPMENAASRSNRRETDGKGREERLAIASPNASLDSRNFSALQPLLQLPLMPRSKKIHDLITNKESHEAAWRDTGGEPEEDAEEIREGNGNGAGGG